MWRASEFRRFVEQDPADRRRVLRAACRLAVVDGLLRIFGYSTLLRLFGRLPFGSRPRIGTIDEWVRAVDIAVRHNPYPMRCLPRALALRSLLAEEGIATELRIGVRKEGDGLAAHAWIEHRGVPVGEALEIAERFAPLARTDGAEGEKAARGAFC